MIVHLHACLLIFHRCLVSNSETKDYLYGENVYLLQIQLSLFIKEKKKGFIMSYRQRGLRLLKRDLANMHDYGCIYKISNKENSKFFIGSSINYISEKDKPNIQDIKAFNKSHYTGNNSFYNDVKHYGIENFEVKILSEFRDVNITSKCLNLLLKSYIVRKKPQYNMYKEKGRVKHVDKNTYTLDN